MGFTLRDYQQEAIDVLAYNVSKGERRQLVSLPTGAGKTVVFSGFIECMRDIGRGRVLVLAHRDELIEQAAKKVAEHMSNVEIGIVKGSRNEIDKQIIVASIQTIGRQARLEQFKRDAFDVIIIDEAHHAKALSYIRVMNYFGAFTPAKNSVVVGFTATPQRPGLDRLFNLVYHKDISEMIAKGYLTPIHATQVKTEIQLDVNILGDDFDEGELNKHVNTPERNAMVVEKYMENAYGEKTIAFTVGVDHAVELAKMFNTFGVSAMYLHAGTPKQKREKILQMHQEGQLKVVCNCGILTEGYDDPSITTILMARPTLSSTLYTQMAGRGLRLHPGKEICKLIDFVDNANRHDLMTAPFLFPEFNQEINRGGTSSPKMGDLAQDADEVVELPSYNLSAEDIDVDMFSIKNKINWADVEGDLVFRANRSLVVKVVNNCGWYNITVVHEKKLPDGKVLRKNKTLNKAPYVTQGEARHNAEIYLVKMNFVGSKNKRSHRNNPNCQRLIKYVSMATELGVILTDKEIELLKTFMDPQQGNFQINKTGKLLGCTHTNVWVRLYGNKAGELGGILRKFVEAYGELTDEEVAI